MQEYIDIDFAIGLAIECTRSYRKFRLQIVKCLLIDTSSQLKYTKEIYVFNLQIFIFYQYTFLILQVIFENNLAQIRIKKLWN
jgi:hypothetical protein